jgi:hypothetical protein
MKWYWILSKAFSASIEMIKWFLSLLLLMYYITCIDLHMFNKPCIPGMKLTLVVVNDLFDMFWICFAIILLKVFASIFIKEIGL